MSEQVTKETQVWWMTSGYGYEGRIPCVLLRMSKSGKRAKIRVLHKQGYVFTTYVKKENLESRV